MSFLAVNIAPVPTFVLITYSFETQVMLLLILIDFQYSQNAVFEWSKSLLLGFSPSGKKIPPEVFTT